MARDGDGAAGTAGAASGCGASVGAALSPTPATRGGGGEATEASSSLPREQRRQGLHFTRPPRRAYVETYGCQMNVSDSEIVASVLVSANYEVTDDVEAADVILVNTCAIRDGAEAKIWHRLRQLKAVKAARESLARRAAKKARKLARRAVSGTAEATSADAEAEITAAQDAAALPPPVVGILGCMGERLKEKLLETDGLADLVAGPDAYRDLPRLIDAARGNVDADPETGGAHGAAINVQLSLEETYADIAPVRRGGAGSPAFVSIMRGCNNMCAFCIVPFTRGRERSRPHGSVLDEVRRLSDEGFKEVILLGQNVNSYADLDAHAAARAAALNALTGEESGVVKDPFATYYARGFRSVYKPKREGALRFAELLDAVADVDPEMRVRFTSPHPKDFPDEVLRVIADRPNVAKQLHMPAQSGSTTVLERMRRGYTREAYVELALRARHVVPGVALSSDFISGFCGETEEEHADTLSLMRMIKYEHAYMFAYSMRDKTAAARHLVDDVEEDVKGRRLAEVIATQREEAEAVNTMEVGRVHCVLVEGTSKRSDAQMSGRTCTNKRVIVSATSTAAEYSLEDMGSRRVEVDIAPGDYVAVRIDRANASTLVGTPLGRTSLMGFHRIHGAGFTLTR